MALLTNLAFQGVRIAATGWFYIESSINALATQWDRYWHSTWQPYFARDLGIPVDSVTHVPAEGMFLDEVAPDKIRVLYEDDEILPYEGDATKSVVTPWLWVGHAPTETDLTRAMEKYLVPGNFILLDLLMYVSGREDPEGFMYMDTAMELRKFPVEGIRLETQDDDAVSDSGEIHSAS